MLERSAKKFYVLAHVLALASVLLFRRVVSSASVLLHPFVGCFLHDFLHLYCPFCGGTRAVSALLRLDLLAAFRYNAFVCVFAFCVVVWDLMTLIRMLRKQVKWWSVPHWSWIALVIFFCAFFVLRNLLMIFCGYDPTGDLGIFWTS